MAEESRKTPYVSWQAPEVDDSRHLRPVDVESARKLAWEQGYADGYDIGMDAGSRDGAACVAYLNEILRSLAEPFEDLDEDVASEMVQLVKVVSQQLVRREMQIDTGHVIGIIREGLQSLPVSQRDVRIIVHPKDAELIRERLDIPEDDHAWTLQTDATMQRGSCRLVAENAQIDGRLETRLARVVAGMMEGEREDDSV